MLTQVINRGGGPIGSYDAEIRLSTDPFITTSDVLVSTFSSSDLGYRNVHGLVPAFTSPGWYYWGLIIHPIAGETNVSNNRAVGNAVEICPPWVNTGLSGS